VIRTAVVGRVHEGVPAGENERGLGHYAADAEHNRIRAEIFAPICEIILWVRFVLPD
jgi:hypothetical protein